MSQIVSVLFPDRPVHPRAVIGCTESHSLAVDPQTYRSRSGRTTVLPTSFRRKWSISLSNSGDHVVNPLDSVEVGERLRLFSSVWWSVPIPPGVMSVPLTNAPVSETTLLGDVIAMFKAHFPDQTWLTASAFPKRGADGWLIDASWDRMDSRKAELPIVFEYRPVLDCIVTDISWSGGGSTLDGGWSVTLEEERAA